MRDKSGRFPNEIPSSSWSCPPPTPRQLQCGCRWLPPRGRDTHRMLISALCSRNARQRREYFLSRSAPTVRVRVFSGALSRLVWTPWAYPIFFFHLSSRPGHLQVQVASGNCHARRPTCLTPYLSLLGVAPRLMSSYQDGADSEDRVWRLHEFPVDSATSSVIKWAFSVYRCCLFMEVCDCSLFTVHCELVKSADASRQKASTDPGTDDFSGLLVIVIVKLFSH